MRLADEGLAVAMSGPPTPEQLRQLQTAAGRPVSIVLAPNADVRTLIDRSYRALSGLDDLVSASQAPAVPGYATTVAVTGTTDDTSPVAQLVNRIVTQAVRQRASDVHLEPQETRYGSASVSTAPSTTR